MLHSDGVPTHWGWKDFPDWSEQPAGVMARRMLDVLAKDEDDATVLIVRKVMP